MKKLAIVLLSVTLMFGLLLNFADTKVIQTNAIGEEFTAKSALLIDYDSGQILFEKNSKNHLPIASMVKLMTILLTLEAIDNGQLELTQEVVASKNASGMGGSQVFIDANSEYTVEELLKSAIVASANDAAVALAETICGSENEFVQLMNTRASQLKMDDTNYVNATGLPAPNNYSCALDVSTVTREVLKHDIYYDYSGIWMDSLTHKSGRVTELVNTNRLIKYYQGCDGGKTGSTSEAKYCVSATAEKNNLRLISVILGADSGAIRFSEAASLFDYGFANFESKAVFTKGEEIVDLEIDSANIKSFKPIVAKDCRILSKKNEKKEIVVKFEFDKTKAPMKVNEKIGTAYVIRNGIVVDEVDVLAPYDINKSTIFDSIKVITKHWTI